ncbi:MAG: winged helix-turn-helix domain-containing protein [Acidobacteriota bacterium]
MSDPAPSRYRFGPFELDVDERTLERDGAPIALQELPLRLLSVLVQEAPALVTRDALRQALWPPDTHLDVDASLNTAVARVREALGDTPGDPRYVATVPRRGYRLVAPVTPAVAEAPRVESPTPARPPRWSRAQVAMVIFAVAGSLALGALLMRQVPPAAPSHSQSIASTRDAAREHLLIARHYEDRRSREGLEKAIAEYQSSLALQPASAEAYSGLASSYVLLGVYDYWRPRDAFGPAATMAERALELDPESARAHLTQSMVAVAARWDWQAGESALERARELAPDAADVRFWQGIFLSARGRHAEAVAATESALASDPTSPVFNTGLAWRLFEARRNDEAIAQSHRALGLTPDYYDAWDNHKWIQVTLGNATEAVEAWARADELDGKDSEGVLELYRKQGLRALHQASIRGQLERADQGRYHSPYDLVLEYAALGEVEPAMTWLEKSLAERETDLITMAADPRLDVLREAPRFQVILGEVGARSGS